MNNNSDNKDILYEIIGGFEDELVEKAADYKKSSKILSFPFYRYVNAVAAFLICIISAVVFIQLKPIIEIDESLIIPTNQPKITATPDPTDEPVVTMVPTVEDVETETPSASLNPGKLPVATLRPMRTKEPVITVAPTKKPIVVVVPTKKPVVTIKPIIIIRPTKAPVETPIVLRTPEPGAIVTATPDLEPVPTETSEPVPTAPIITTEPPVRTIEPTNVPPVVTVEPTNAPPVRTVEPTNTPPVRTVEPTNTPPVRTVEPTNTPPVRTVEPTNVPPKETSTPIVTAVPTGTPEPLETETPEPTPIPTATVEPTLRPTAPPLNIEDCTAVEGKPVTIKRLNGAVYDEDTDIIEFTKESENNEKGVEIVNPIAGNESMIADYGYLMNIDTNGLLNAFHLSGSSLGWGTDGEKLPIPETQYVNGKPMYSCDNRLYRRYADSDFVYYPKPESKSGFSISFWANNSRFCEGAPAVTFLNSYHCVVVRINGNVNYTDATDGNNKFSASVKNGAVCGEWHYYTITFANDWITYYVDGIEVPYDKVELDALYIKSFNDGFLTRYNSTLGWDKEDISNDWRGYLSQQISEGSNITRSRYTVIDNSRYMGINNTKKLLLSFMASEETRVLLGGGYAGYYHNIAVYWNNAGTKYAQVKYYDVELTNKNVYANYHEALKSKPD